MASVSQYVFVEIGFRMPTELLGISMFSSVKTNKKDLFFHPVDSEEKVYKMFFVTTKAKKEKYPFCSHIN